MLFNKFCVFWVSPLKNFGGQVLEPITCNFDQYPNLVFILVSCEDKPVSWTFAFSCTYASNCLVLLASFHYSLSEMTVYCSTCSILCFSCRQMSIVYQIYFAMWFCYNFFKPPSLKWYIAYYRVIDYKVCKREKKWIPRVKGWRDFVICIWCIQYFLLLSDLHLLLSVAEDSICFTCVRGWRVLQSCW